MAIAQEDTERPVYDEKGNYLGNPPPDHMEHQQRGEVIYATQPPPQEAEPEQPPPPQETEPEERREPEDVEAFNRATAQPPSRFTPPEGATITERNARG